MDTCPHCGWPRENPDARFCLHCGKPLAPPAGQADPAAGAPTCPQCGRLRESPGDVFCPACGMTYPPPPGQAQGPPGQPPAYTQAAPPPPGPWQTAGLPPQGGPGATGAVPPAYPPPLPGGVYPAAPAQAKKPGRGLIIALAAVLLLLVFAGAVLGFLTLRNRPEAVVGDFVDALAAQDAQALAQAALVEGVGAGGDNWPALCRAFEDAADRQALTQQLLDGSGDAPFGGFILRSEPLFLFIQRRQVVVRGVALTLAGEADGARIQLDGTALTGAAGEGGIRFEGVFPGAYSLEILRADGQITAPAEIALLGDTHYTAPDGGAPAPSAPDDGAAEPPAEAQPEPPPPSSSSQTPEEFADAVSAEEMHTALQAFYMSYLECINRQDISPLRASSSYNVGNVLERLEAPGNQANVFDYRGVQIDPDSVVTAQDAGQPSLLFNATFQYRYAPRDGGEWMMGSNRQSVQLVYEQGQWVVNRFVFVSDENFENHILADFSAS